MDNQLTQIQSDKLIVQAPIPHELKLQKSILKRKGLQLFAWNHADGSLKLIRETHATVEITTDKRNLLQDTRDGDIFIPPGDLTRHKVNIAPQHVYFQALNLKNAMKKVMKMIQEIEKQ